MAHWSESAVFYHIYPLGLSGAPARNDFQQPTAPRLEQLYEWVDHLVELGVNALYLGPVFESSTHGYDTVDYFQVDRRLGSNETLGELCARLHARGIRVVLDGVFNHVGRDFWAFRDVLAHGAESAYRDWFYNLQFGGRSPKGDPFTYEGWAGHYSLVKLNLHNPAVKEQLFAAVAEWVRQFGIDGLRLDAADCLDEGFRRELAAFVHSLRQDLWLLGEVVHGDYRKWANPEMLDAVTNYECYKGLYSSLAEANYFEIAYALNRQFGAGGLYRETQLYNFVDNHDVNRAASNLRKPAHLYPLYCLLFTMPGIPSIYYGSEWGLSGKRSAWSDRELRPALNLRQMEASSPHPELTKTIARLAQIRKSSPALLAGDYRQVSVTHEQLAFARWNGTQAIYVLLNAAEKPAGFELAIQEEWARRLVDLLNPGEAFPVRQGKAQIPAVYPNWGRILRVEG